MESPTTPPTDDPVIAGRRAEHVAVHGATVVGISQQVSLAGLSILLVLLALPSALRPATVIWFVLAVVGAVVTIVNWIRARRRRTLLPFMVEEPERPLQVLDKVQCRAVKRQIQGRDPVNSVTAPLVRGMHLWQRRSSRAALPSLVGMGLSLVGLAGSSVRTAGGWGMATLVLELAVAVMITVAGLVEARRRTRVLAATAELLST